ncbi:hypothetical protein ACFFU8_12745 [Chromobacterium piscinae]|uniref:hypothetical protein n=1 Tax=Chromobacterium piscinae TaxID=686831 RepID=UPI001E543CB4|nr:hypothetical protein [Chromobacterium piscinae]MCD5328416.1 hypothetical protein [Chromobacterium piscinae]
MNLHIIYTKREILLSKRTYASWKAIQSEYINYKTSLGPWTANEAIEYLAEEHADLEPSAEQQVTALVLGSQQVHTLSFRQK